MEDEEIEGIPEDDVLHIFTLFDKYSSYAREAVELALEGKTEQVEQLAEHCMNPIMDELVELYVELGYQGPPSWSEVQH